MKVIRCCLLAALTLSAGVLAAAPLGTAFTYQGRLIDAGNPANGGYDLTFALFSINSGPGQIGFTITNQDVAVSNGLFTVSVDFGANALVGEARWLEIGVRPGASTGAFATLVPRQPLTPSPYALFAPTAGGVPNGAITSAMLANNAVTSAKLAAGAVTSVQLADSIALGNTNINGRLDIYRSSPNTPGISLIGGTQLISLFGNDGIEKTHIEGGPSG